MKITNLNEGTAPTMDPVYYQMKIRGVGEPLVINFFSVEDAIGNMVYNLEQIEARFGVDVHLNAEFDGDLIRYRPANQTEEGPQIEIDMTRHYDEPDPAVAIGEPISDPLDDALMMIERAVNGSWPEEVELPDWLDAIGQEQNTNYWMSSELINEGKLVSRWADTMPASEVKRVVASIMMACTAGTGGFDGVEVDFSTINRVVVTFNGAVSTIDIRQVDMPSKSVH